MSNFFKPGKLYEARKLAFRYLAIMFAIGLLASFLRLQLKTYSQASGCPQTKTPRWAPGTTVYYNFGNITDEGMKNQIRDGAAKWTQANQSDGSGVKFVEGPPPQGKHEGRPIAALP
jgi:hypothetical protein